MTDHDLFIAAGACYAELLAYEVPTFGNRVMTADERASVLEIMLTAAKEAAKLSTVSK